MPQRGIGGQVEVVTRIPTFSVSQAGVTLGPASQASRWRASHGADIRCGPSQRRQRVLRGVSKGGEGRVVEPAVPDGGLRRLK